MAVDGSLRTVMAHGHGARWWLIWDRTTAHGGVFGKKTEKKLKKGREEEEGRGLSRGGRGEKWERETKKGGEVARKLQQKGWRR